MSSMFRKFAAAATIALLVAPMGAQQPAAKHAAVHSQLTIAQQKAFVEKYCADCHNDQDKKGGFSFSEIDFAHPERNAELSEAVLSRLNTGIMPPPGEDRPGSAELNPFIHTLASHIDAVAAAQFIYRRQCARGIA